MGDELALLDPYGKVIAERQSVAADGKILMKEVGWLFVAGLTREDAAAAATKALEPFHASPPEARIRVESSDPRR